MNDKIAWENGQELIKAMQKEQNIQWWSNDNLIKYLHDHDDSQVGKFVDLSDPKKYKNCARLDGEFSIAELHAIVIALMNDRGNVEFD